MSIYRNEYLELSKQQQVVYVTTFQSGFDLKNFDVIMRQYPRIKLTNFTALKQALATPTAAPVEIGVWQPAFSIDVSRDKMTATITLYEIATQFTAIHVQDELQRQGIVFGVQQLDYMNLPLGKAHLIAIGQQPVRGQDAIVTYLEIPERKPVIREDGRADYYEMNFIYEIKQGAWLGEKTFPQPGIDGKNIYGTVLAAPPGVDVPLLYDRKSAYEVEEDGKMILRSRIDGAVERTHGIVGVSKHLMITGDVGLSTGNIDFDGSVTVSGTVSPGFSVIATGDISIESLEGASGAAKIISHEGDIYIRGGIFGLSQTEIYAGNNVYVKHINDAKVTAENELHIGFYALGSDLQGHSVFVNTVKGKIIGGTTCAKSSIEVAILGNSHERKTEVRIDAVNKELLMHDIQKKATELKMIQDQIEEIETQLTRLRPLESRLNQKQLVAFEELKLALRTQTERALHLDRQLKIEMSELRYAGKEEIHVVKDVFPGTILMIGEKRKYISKRTNGRFKIDMGELNV